MISEKSFENKRDYEIEINIEDKNFNVEGDKIQQQNNNQEKHIIKEKDFILDA